MQKNTEPKKILKEFRVSEPNNFKEGNELGLEILKDKKFVDVRSKTIGKGFAGPMKRWNFGGLELLTVFQYLIDHTVHWSKTRSR